MSAEKNYPVSIIYNSSQICLSQIENCRSQLLFDRLGRWFKLFVSTDGPSSHEFASQTGPAILNTRKTTKKTIATAQSSANVWWMNQRATRRKGAVTPVTVDRSPANSRNGNNTSSDNCGHSAGRLSQDGEKLQDKTARQREFISSRLEKCVS